MRIVVSAAAAEQRGEGDCAYRAKRVLGRVCEEGLWRKKAMGKGVHAR